MQTPLDADPLGRPPWMQTSLDADPLGRPPQANPPRQTPLDAEPLPGQTPPPPLWIEGMTHACENIAFPQLLLRAVTIDECYYFNIISFSFVQIIGRFGWYRLLIFQNFPIFVQLPSAYVV